jgi:hypothetical protein
VARRGERDYPRLADLDRVVLADTSALEGDLVGVRDVDRRAGRFAEPATAREVVGVIVRFQDVGDLEALLLGEPQVLLDLPFRVDDRSLAIVGDQMEAQPRS